MLPSRPAPPSTGAIQARAVAALRAALGLGAPAEPPGEAYRLEVEGTEVELRAAPDGRHAVLVGRLGWLDADPRRAEGQLRELLRLGVALPISNRAGLCLLGEATEDVAGRRGRMADIALGRGRPAAVGAAALFMPEAAGDALKDIVHWAELGSGLLGARPGDGPDSADKGTSAQGRGTMPAEAGGMMIFRP